MGFHPVRYNKGVLLKLSIRYSIKVSARRLVRLEISLSVLRGISSSRNALMPPIALGIRVLAPHLASPCPLTHCDCRGQTRACDSPIIQGTILHHLHIPADGDLESAVLRWQLEPQRWCPPIPFHRCRYLVWRGTRGNRMFLGQLPPRRRWPQHWVGAVCAPWLLQENTPKGKSRGSNDTGEREAQKEIYGLSV